MRVEELKLDGVKERYQHGLTLAAITEIYGPAALLRVMNLAADPAFIAKTKAADDAHAARRKKEAN
ncbi:hypothetical protein B9J07_28115 [Sinorhizobium sp. LM21]|uniref:hypothetical protein n=1 Tax=Sinorhizobium sp. LM21 TaxID=1449788 RepID=UPI0005D964B7|nr:hypothetical protein [Sinorhizobium sp. LM21]AJW30142.1 hypothetical protein pLM21S1_p21 [Sinorhizobium sp. LM21]OWZ90453.1 hypothetical protein B9J07_28115 [Sinorhizobium sp. LM21]